MVQDMGMISGLPDNQKGNLDTFTSKVSFFSLRKKGLEPSRRFQH